MTYSSIKGFKLKNLTKFKGHEQEPLYQGDIYYNGRKVGWYSDDFNGGEPWIDLPDDIYKLLEKVSKEYLKTKYKDHKFMWGVSTFFSEIIELNIDEKFYNQQKKKGLDILVVFKDKKSKYPQEKLVAFKGIEYVYKYLEKNTDLDIARSFTSNEDFIIG